MDPVQENRFHEFPETPVIGYLGDQSSVVLEFSLEESSVRVVFDFVVVLLLTVGTDWSSFPHPPRPSCFIMRTFLSYLLGGRQDDCRQIGE